MSALLLPLREAFANQPTLSLSEYMSIVLQDPTYGYYRKANPIGRDGDFITAPEISQMFGEMIGIFFVDLWQRSGMPNPFSLLELGPGRGTLLSDLMQSTRKIRGFHEACQLAILESNEILREQQEVKLAHYHPHYLKDLSTLPPSPLFGIANEFFDALPINQYERLPRGWYERRVCVTNGSLNFHMEPLGDTTYSLIPPDLWEARVGTIYETSHMVRTFARHLVRHIEHTRGALLIIDYGYAHPTGQGTLQALSQHKACSILERPGEVDLTAHLDFSVLKAEATRGALVVKGPIPQAEFLRSMGIEIRAARLGLNATNAQKVELQTALHRLLHPSEMGHLFKVMAIMHSSLSEVAGFA